jgi:hypothetical protein
MLLACRRAAIAAGEQRRAGKIAMGMRRDPEHREDQSMRILPLFAAVLIGFASLPALAQNPPQGTPTRIRGTVEKLDGKMLTVKSRDGQSVTIALADNVTVSTLVKKKLADIKAGDYVASTGVKGTDGKLHAVEVRIFPENMRGVGEGQFPWDLTPDSTMTNATVTGVATAAGGQLLKVKYKDSESEYIVGPEVPVLGIGPGDLTLLKPGIAVFVIAQKQPDGSITAARLYAEKDGIKPPM